MLTFTDPDDIQFKKEQHHRRWLSTVSDIKLSYTDYSEEYPYYQNLMSLDIAEMAADRLLRL